MTRTRGTHAATSASRAGAGRGGRGGRGSVRPRPLAPVARNAGRRRMSGAILTVVVTLAVAIGSYTVSARVSAERQEVERAARANAALARQVHTLGQELRVRMRLPQLQSWNDSTLRMQPASARQLLRGTAELAVYALDRPPPAGPLLVVAEPAPTIPLRALPRPVEAQEQPMPPPPGPPAMPGLVLASVAAVIDAEIAAAPDEGSGLPPAEMSTAPIPPVEP